MALKSAKQKMFVKEYLVDLNATQAAIRAGYSASTANKTGPKLLVNPGVQVEIQKGMAKRAEKTGLTAEKVLRDINLIKENAMSKNPDGGMIDRPAALKACELEGKHLKLFTDKIDIRGEVTMQSFLDGIRK